jgi:surface polysaccharide O-acyltransferase-like enzyme
VTPDPATATVPESARERHARHLAFTSYLRILAIVAVVGIHTLTAIVGNEAIHDSRTWVVATALNRSLSWAVPLFVMVSGALLLAPVEGETPGMFYRRRLRRIAIPLLAAHVGYFALRAILGEQLTPQLIVHDLLATTVYTQLYFFWIILGLYLVTPLIRAFLVHRPQDALLLGAAALGFALSVTIGSAGLRWTGTGSIPWQPPMLMLWIPFLGYFILGHALRGIVLERRGLMAAAAVLAVACGVTAWEFITERPHTHGENLLGGNYPGVPVAVATIAVFLLGRGLVAPDSVAAGPRFARRARTLGELTLGVFIVHMAVLRIFRAFVPFFAFGLNATSLGRSLLLWGVTVVASFALSAAIARVPLVRRTIGL